MGFCQFPHLQLFSMTAYRIYKMKFAHAQISFFPQYAGQFNQIIFLLFSYNYYVIFF